LPAWAAITLPVAVTLKRFFAPDFVFNLGILTLLWLRDEKRLGDGLNRRLVLREPAGTMNDRSARTFN
jgi:hypothetical protein